MKILIIGESCLDIFQYGSVDRLAPESPAVVFCPTYKTENTGMAGNTLANVLSLGASAFLCSNDNWREITKTRYIEYKSNHMLLRIDQNDSMYGKLNIKNIDFSNYDAVLISDYNKGFLSHKDIQNITAMHPLTFIDTKKSCGRWLKNASFIKINEYEFKKSKNNLSKDILDKLIITLGPNGAMHKGIVYPVPKVEIRDQAGSGDTFIAALTVKYIETKNIEESIKFANECATKVVQHRGVVTV